MTNPESETRFAVLFFTDIVGSTDLKARHGVPAYSAALRVHNDHFERIARECRGVHILQNMGDGYFAEAGSVAEAVRFALLFQDSMRAGPWGEIRLTTRVGIHAGEVTAIVTESGSGIVAPAADLAARVMSLAVSGQILLSRFPFDEARHFLREHPPLAGRDTPPLRWLAHGPYLLKGRDEPMDIFEVGAEGLAPLTPPPNNEKAKRAIRPGEEETLGWRPAMGLEIPGRSGWRLIAKLGCGGFGEVWTGEHTKLRQRRAFKFCFDDERLRALKREVTLVRLLRTALGDREDIVRFHELKLDESPFYLESDLAPHGNLLQWAEKQGGLAAIPLAQRINLVAHTATALAAAHSIGVLHKDIKPTNILIFDAPDAARPRLVDFGIGTLADPAVLGQHGVTAAGFTRASSMRSTGTPTYSPPEYLAGKPYTVQGDIYGLGVLLYQLIAAKPRDPLAPGWERDITDPLLREDIAACVDGDPARRLSSAAELATRLSHLDQRRAEIAEHERLAGEAAARVEAEARELAERHRRKEIERHNIELRTLLAEAARSDRLVADEKLRIGQGPAAFAYLARACEYDPQATLAAEKAAAALNTWDYPVPIRILSGHDSSVIESEFSPDSVRIITATVGAARVWDANSGRILVTLADQGERLASARFSPDGKRIVTASWSTARVWCSVTGKPLTTLSGHEDWITSARFSPDGRRIVTASQDQTVRVWDSINGAILSTLIGPGDREVEDDERVVITAHEDRIISALFSPDGTRIVTASRDKTARLWDASTGELIATLAGHERWLESAEFSPDGTRIVTVAKKDKTARVWEVIAGSQVTTPNAFALNRSDGGVWEATLGNQVATLSNDRDFLTSARFSPDGSHIVTASDNGTAMIWETRTGRLVTTLRAGESPLTSALFSPDGRCILTVSTGTTAQLWDALTGELVATLSGHEEKITTAAFSSYGTWIVTASEDRTARLWEAVTAKPITILTGLQEWMPSAQFSRDGTRVVAVCDDKTANVWNVGEPKLITKLAGHDDLLTSAEFSPDGTRIVTASKDKTARVWNAWTGEPIATLTGHFRRVSSAQFSPDGTRVVTMSHDRNVGVWEAATGMLIAILTGHSDSPTAVQFNADGTRILTASEDETACLWDALTGECLATLRGHEWLLASAKFSPDGKRVVTASFDKTARVWDADTGKCLIKLIGHDGSLVSAHFSPDGARILTASKDQTARIWDAITGEHLLKLTGHNGPLTSARFSFDGTRTITASEDATARIWDAATGKTVATLRAHEQSVTGAEFGHDGMRILTASQDKTARIWSVIPPTAGAPPDWFPDFLRYMAQARLNSDGELEALKTADWLALRERLRGVVRAITNADTPYLRILGKYVCE